MLYQVSIKDKFGGKIYAQSAVADNYPNAVKDAMGALNKKLDPPTWLIPNKAVSRP